MPENTEKGQTTELVKNVLHFMHGSCQSFDDEILGEATRLAVCLKALVHDSIANRSLLGRLGHKNMYFYDICPDYDPSLGLPFSGLAIVIIGGGRALQRYVPRLDLSPRVVQKKASFDQWWSRPVIIDEKKKMSLARKGIILSAANTALGGVDKKLNADYEALLKDLPRSSGEEEMLGVSSDMTQVIAASVRHIAFELLLSIEEQFPDYLIKEQ
jgi:hypothetical protein